MEKADPTQIAPAEAAKLLSEEGQCEILAARIEADIRAGAPTNADGTLNLIHYAAWILKHGD
jgi:hypothetical protein